VSTVDLRRMSREKAKRSKRENKSHGLRATRLLKSSPLMADATSDQIQLIMQLLAVLINQNEEKK
jgi:hypothetical protein